MDTSSLHVKHLEFLQYPFSTTFVGTIPHPCDQENCGLQVADDSHLHRSYVTSVAPSSSASTIHKNLKDTLKKIRGAYITKINDTNVFSSANVKQALLDSQKKGGNISITFALEPKLTAKQLRQAYSDFNLFLPAASKGYKAPFVQPPGPTNPEDDQSPRLPLGTKVYKCFDNLQYPGKVVHYDMDAAYYKILYDDGDNEEMTHNEVKQHLQKDPKTKLAPLQQLASHFAPTEHDEAFMVLPSHLLLSGSLPLSDMGLLLTHLTSLMKSLTSVYTLWDLPLLPLLSKL